MAISALRTTWQRTAFGLLFSAGKNRLFSGTPEGAEASALFYSLIETAKANKLEPYAYLRYIFDKLPLAETLEDYEALLPWNLSREQLAVPNLVTCG